MAIVRGIWSVVIEPVNRMAGGTAAHVGEKVFVASAPSFTDCDSASAVAREIFVVGVAAAFAHSVPCSIFARWLSIYRSAFTFAVLPVCFAVFAARLLLSATAGCSIALAQGVGTDCDFVSAITAAEPQGASVFTFRHADDGQSRISMSCDINQAHGTPLLKVACEVATGVYGVRRCAV